VKGLGWNGDKPRLNIPPSCAKNEENKRGKAGGGAAAEGPTSKPRGNTTESRLPEQGMVCVMSCSEQLFMVCSPGVLTLLVLASLTAVMQVIQTPPLVS